MSKYRSFIILLLVGCQSGNQTYISDLVVIEQLDTIQGVHDDNDYWENAYCTATFNIDVPSNGSQMLVDSVLSFLNKKMYYFCEWCAHESSLYEDDRCVKSFRPEEVFTNDGERFLENYLKKYRPLIQDSLWCEFFGMDLKLESQTGSFVTYGHEDNACGANCSSRKYYYVFDKHDGHIVKEIISKENINSSSRIIQNMVDYVATGYWDGLTGSMTLIISLRTQTLDCAQIICQ